MFRLLLLLLLASSAAAQTAPAVPAPPPLTTTDTTRALHHLFQSRRSLGGWLVGGSAGLTIGAGVAGAATDNGEFLDPGGPASALIAAILLTPAWVPGTVTLARFGRRREQRVVREYEQTGHLPAYVRKRLAGKFFGEGYGVGKPGRN